MCGCSSSRANLAAVLVEDPGLLAAGGGGVHLGALDGHQVVERDRGEERRLAVALGIITASSRSGRWPRLEIRRWKGSRSSPISSQKAANATPALSH